MGLMSDMAMMHSPTAREGVIVRHGDSTAKWFFLVQCSESATNRELLLNITRHR